MTNKVLKTISEHKMTTECDVLGVGLSGGADSVCLAHVLIKNKDVLGIKSIKGIHIQPFRAEPPAVASKYPP